MKIGLMTLNMVGEMYVTVHLKDMRIADPKEMAAAQALDGRKMAGRQRVQGSLIWPVW